MEAFIIIKRIKIDDSWESFPTDILFSKQLDAKYYVEDLNNYDPEGYAIGDVFYTYKKVKIN